MALALGLAALGGGCGSTHPPTEPRSSRPPPHATRLQLHFAAPPLVYFGREAGQLPVFVVYVRLRSALKHLGHGEYIALDGAGGSGNSELSFVSKRHCYIAEVDGDRSEPVPEFRRPRAGQRVTVTIRPTAHGVSAQASVRLNEVQVRALGNKAAQRAWLKRAQLDCGHFRDGSIE